MTFIPKEQEKECFVACSEDKVKAGLCNCVNRMGNKPLYQNNLTKDEILSTGDWIESSYIGNMNEYFWKHKSIQADGYVFCMKRRINNGFTIIEEVGKDDNKLFEGYIENLSELKQVMHLCRLHEI